MRGPPASADRAGVSGEVEAGEEPEEVVMKGGSRLWIQHHPPLVVHADQYPDRWVVHVLGGRGKDWCRVYENKDLSDPGDGDAVCKRAIEEYRQSREA